MEVDKDNDVINAIKLAINTIDKADYEVPKSERIADELNVYDDRFSTYENNFVTKFNEKYYAGILNGEIVDYKGLIRQLQIPKKYIYSDKKDVKIERGYNKILKVYGNIYDGIKDLELIPDFFIHKNQEDDSIENQKLIIEFKTEKSLSEKKFAWDFFKLNIYLEKYNFQNAFFVSINTQQSIIENHLIFYFEKKLYLSNHTDRLHVLIKEDYESDIHYLNVQEIMYKYGYK